MDSYKINLSINSNNISPIAAAVQGDTGRVLECQITDWEIPSGATGNFYALKPSGKYIQKSASISGNAVTVELDNQILAEPGLTTAQIEIMQSGEKVKSFSFFIKVGKSLAGDWPESENEPTYLDGVLQQMQAQLDTAIAAANEATNAANTAAGSANSVISAAQEAADAANKAAETVDNIVVDFGNTPITFTQAAARENIASGETVITAFGKISKWFADLGNSAVAAFKRIANNLTTTQDGYVLDARQGKSLSDRIGELNALATSNKSSIVNAINELNSKSIGNNAGGHNSIFRGKNLGTSFTPAMSTAIQNGTFDDLYIGDYWVIGGVTWRIAAFDYYYLCGDTSFTSHHVVIVPDTCLYTHNMNDAGITTGAYMGSKMYTEGLDQAKTQIQSAFGSSHVLTHRLLLMNATSNGYASAGTWVDSTVDLMCENMVYGSLIFSPVSNGTNIPYNYRIEKGQLPLFALAPQYIHDRSSSYWLRDVISSGYFATVYFNGLAGTGDPSDDMGVRPAFCIG